MADTASDIQRLLTTPAADRDPAWVSAFLADVADARFSMPKPQTVMLGAFPHLVLKSDPSGSAPTAAAVTTLTTIRESLETCLKNGLGIVINPKGRAADWNFTFGDLWSFKENATWPAPHEPVRLPSRETELLMRSLERAEGVSFVEVDDVSFPPFARAAVKKLFARLSGALTDREPRVCLAHAPGKEPSIYFIFDFSRKDLPSDQAFAQVAGLLSFYLKPDVGVGWCEPSQTELAGILKSF